MSTNIQPEPQPVSGATLRRRARQLITNPVTGNTYRVHRPSIEEMIVIGELPAEFIKLMRSEEKTGGQDDDEAQMNVELSAEEMKHNALAIEQARRAAVSAGLDSPRIVKDPQADDECTYVDIPAEDRIFIHDWMRGLSQGATVQTEGGEINVSDLANFSDSGRRSERAGVADGGGSPAHEPVAAAEAV